MFFWNILCVLSAHILPDIIHIPDTSPTKGDVALIRASNGTVLCKVADDPEWQIICQEGDRRCQEAAAARLKKHGPSCKRPCTETMSSGNTPEGLGGPLLPDLPMVPPPVSPVRERTHTVGHLPCMSVRLLTSTCLYPLKNPIIHRPHLCLLPDYLPSNMK